MNLKIGADQKWSFENEIAVPKSIKASDIVGAYEVKTDGSLGEFIPNPSANNIVYG